MTRTALALLATLALASACTLRQAGPAERTVAYANARCFEGAAFAPCTLYVAGDRFVAPLAHPDSTVDLHGGFVVPPFAEAHNHNVEPSSRVDALLKRYLRDGVFYVENPDNLPGARAALAGRIDGPTRPDVIFANGGLTGPGGHPMEIANANIARGRWKARDGEGAFYFTVRDSASLEAAWSRLLATRPDIVKTYLLFSGEYAARLADSTTVGWRGLDPALLHEIVRRAHAAGLRVATHIESARDFHEAVAAGVDQIAHLPGFRGNERVALPDPSRYLIVEDDAREAARKGIVVVTTIGGIAAYAEQQHDTALRRAADRLNAANIALLRRHGVTLAVGSDEYSDDSVAEARYLASLDVLGPAAVLRMWTEATPRAIFPGRRIGRLAPDYEASFLVLAGDPLADFANVARIARRVKQGVELPPL